MFAVVSREGSGKRKENFQEDRRYVDRIPGGKNRKAPGLPVSGATPSEIDTYPVVTKQEISTPFSDSFYRDLTTLKLPKNQEQTGIQLI